MADQFTPPFDVDAHQWDSQHDDDCPITANRTGLLEALRKEPRNAYLQGAVPEYMAGGDQEVDGSCTCYVARIADAIMGGEEVEYDLTAMYASLRFVLDYPDFVRLGAALELCPRHYCDIRICADDGLHGDEVYAAFAGDEPRSYVYRGIE